MTNELSQYEKSQDDKSYFEYMHYLLFDKYVSPNIFCSKCHHPLMQHDEMDTGYCCSYRGCECVIQKYQKETSEISSK